MTAVLRIPVPTPTGGQAPEGEGWCSRPLAPWADQPCLGELLGTLRVRRAPPARVRGSWRRGQTDCVIDHDRVCQGLSGRPARPVYDPQEPGPRGPAGLSPK